MEYIDFFDKIQSHLDNKLPFVVYKEPNGNTIQAFLQPTDSSRVDIEFQKAGFVFSPFDKEGGQTVWMYEDECELISTDFINKDNYYLSQKKHPESTIAKQKHILLVDKAIEELRSGELKKVVLSRYELQTINSSEPIKWFKRILNQYENTFCYCWHHPKVGMWLGASPETLISLTKTSFKTMALAGTMPFKGSQDVVWGTKEKEEQQLVVESILEGLKIVTKNIEKGDTTTQKAGELLHLKTIISGELNTSKNIKVLIEVLHPTSAVCGLPKEKSKSFILINEKYERAYYTGYLGVFNPKGNTHLFVNLRCMQVHKNNIEIYVGGGITASSNAEAEWQETVNKSKIMKAVL